MAAVPFTGARAPAASTFNVSTFDPPPVSRTNERLSSLPRWVPTGRSPAGTRALPSGVPGPVAVDHVAADTVYGPAPSPPPIPEVVGVLLLSSPLEPDDSDGGA